MDEVGTEELLLEEGTVELGATVVLSGSLEVLEGRVVSTCAAVVVDSFVVESEHAAEKSEADTKRATSEILFRVEAGTCFEAKFL